MTVGIYCIENKLNRKKYIGQSRDCEKRIRQHFSALRKGLGNKKFQNAYDKNGIENFTSYILEECSIPELDYKEIYYISFHKADGKGGYNISTGGNVPPSWKGRKHSEETKEKIRKSGIGNTRWLGKKHTDEWKRLFSISQKGNKHWLGKIHTAETKRKISQAQVGTKRKINQSSKYFGVSYKPSNGKWVSRITIDKVRIHIGVFDSEIEAAKAYNEKVISSRLNYNLNIFGKI